MARVKMGQIVFKSNEEMIKKGNKIPRNITDEYESILNTFNLKDDEIKELWRKTN